MTAARTAASSSAGGKLLVGREVSFAGHIVNAEGVRPTSDRVGALRDFPVPTDVSGLKSFMGMANQLMAFIPDLSHSMVTMRTLLKKGTTWNWTQEMQEEFDECKRILTSNLLVNHYDPLIPATLITDASSEGLGYMMLQDTPSGQKKIITCGSRSLSDTEKRFAPVEMECLGVKYTVEKCDFYLRGNPHTTTVVTDHRPLVGIFNQPLSTIPNLRLQRMRERMVGMDLALTWRAGKKNEVADALSRYPLFPAPAASPDDGYDDGIIASVRSIIASPPSAGANLQPILEASSDPSYRMVVKAVLKGTSNPRNLGPDHPARLYAAVWDDLSVTKVEDHDILTLDGFKIVVPGPARSKVLDILHLPHTGMVKTKQAARQLYYWPNMSTHIEQRIQSCDACHATAPSKPAAPLTSAYDTVSRPMQGVGMDLFCCNGKDYLLMVDRFSGFPFAAPLASTTSSAVCKQLNEWFWSWGKPCIIRSDGGPQFSSAEFHAWCVEHDIKHEVSSPVNPSSNGLAEAGVKQVKHLMLKCISDGTPWKPALHEYRNTPRADGFSPFQMVFGSRGKTALPALEAALSKMYSREEGREARRKYAAAWEDATADRREHESFEVGDVVYVQDPHTKRWDSKATILEKDVSGNRYHVVGEHGSRVKLRSPRYLSMCRPAASAPAPTAPPPQIPEAQDEGSEKKILQGDSLQSEVSEESVSNGISRADSPPPDPKPPRRSPRLAAKKGSYASVAAAFCPKMAPTPSPNVTWHYRPFVSAKNRPVVRFRL